MPLNFFNNTPLYDIGTRKINDLIPGTGKSPWGIYDASLWDSVNNKLPEARGITSRDANGTAITLTHGTGNGASADIKYITGGTGSTLVWPAGSIPEKFTICSITRYTGVINKQRILTGTSNNWLHGHWGTQRGVAYYEGWKSYESSVGTDTDWLVMSGNNETATRTNILADSDSRGNVTGGTGNNTLCINNFNNEKSDWAFAYLVIYNTVLTADEMRIVHDALREYINPSVPIYDIGTQINHLIPDKSPWGIYDASLWDSVNNKLPEARGITSRDANGTAITLTHGTGNGASADIKYITGGTGSTLVWPAGSIPEKFTICSITRYTGVINKQRILTGTSNNWLHGHWGTQRGVAYYEGWKSYESSVGTDTDWLVMSGNNETATRTNILADSDSRGNVTGGTGNNTLCINNFNNEKSDWAFAYLVIYNTVLTADEMRIVHDALREYIKPTTHITNLEISHENDPTVNTTDISGNVTSYKIYVFTQTSKPYYISYSCNIATNIYALVVAGGGSGGNYRGGGGGGGKVVMTPISIPRGDDTMTITIGAGGMNNNSSGNNSTISFSNNATAQIIATGGGYGNNGNTDANIGMSGGSGGGGGGWNRGGEGGSVTNNLGIYSLGAFYGNTGGHGGPYAGGGGGGAGGVGGVGGVGGDTNGGAGGAGITCNLPGINEFSPYKTYYFGSGGAGGPENGSQGNAGSYSGGGIPNTSDNAYSALPNTGGGGGTRNGYIGTGGSGIVILAVPFIA